MKFLKVLVITMVAMFIVSCGGGANYDTCLIKAKEAMIKKGMPEAQAGPMAEMSCAACKQNKDACKPTIDALSQ